MSPTARELRFRQRQRAARRQAATLAVLATIALVLARALHAGNETVVLRSYFVVLGLIGLAFLVATALWGTEDRTAQGRMIEELGRVDDDEPASVPSGLRQATSTVTLALRSAAGRDRWLRPEVRSIVEARLALAEADGRRGAAAEADARLRAEEHRLAPPTWQLIRPDRPADGSRTVALTPDELASILADLERL